ncbi:MAG: helix-turn-helix domain-containing protein [Sinobacteraceae bacterium]|nr:helix-turn-helix domain-containing protein [Nevskiaceae bacterium]
MQRRDDIYVLRLGLDVLKLFNAAVTLSTGEVASALGSSRAAAYRVIQTLLRLGYIVPVADCKRQRYRQAVKVLGLSQGFNGERRLVHVAQPLMMQHTRLSGWPLSLVIPASDRQFVRITTDHVAPRALTRQLAGRFESLLGSAAGLVCLANRSGLVQATVIRGIAKGDGGDPALTSQPERLHEVLQQVRRDDYAEHQWTGSRERTLAIPIRLHGAFIAALCQRFMVVAAGGRYDQARRLADLRQLGKAIELGLALNEPFESSSNETHSVHH